MGYLEEIKKNNKNLHEHLLGYKKVEGFDDQNKKKLKNLFQKEEGVKDIFNNTSKGKKLLYWSIAASILRLISLGIYQNQEIIEYESLTEDEKVVLNSLFVEDKDLDTFLQITFAEEIKKSQNEK